MESSNYKTIPNFSTQRHKGHKEELKLCVLCVEKLGIVFSLRYWVRCILFPAVREELKDSQS
jgi:hypothetical protein